tara:strand:+ start:343 stop:513 length:171 start_codon:yes stop_codon:yes gene_type:complete
MNIDLIAKLIFLLVLVVYLTQLPTKRLNAFGNFLKKVLGVLPITKVIEAITKSKKT